ncbi:prepilin-type N-terminal cleavage/methylation domain-containing protein [Clostridium chrysemydis]|uniref:prepilin-type N-terminal cleavage/methylation domain-containing protein n=1 Tax=Clostridium chrysemydis TaxID=2665504 RepID=UPI0018831777|nr:prepilin-type N-terminal cleavage/methylation domain-containing protein [Clostridium chrysemydis]
MKKKKGFTLIELIAVVAILAILAAVAVPKVITYVTKSKEVAVKTNCKIIYDATQAAYNDGKLSDLIDPIKKQLESQDKDRKYTDWVALQYVNSEKILDLLIKDKLIKPDNDIENLTKRLGSFGRIEAVVQAPAELIKVDSDGIITEKSSDDVYKYWQDYMS